MIVELLVQALTVPVTFLLGLFPETVDIPAVSVAGESALATIGFMNEIIPLTTFFVAGAVLLAWAVFCHGFRIVLWVLGKLHITGPGS